MILNTSDFYGDLVTPALYCISAQSLLLQLPEGRYPIPEEVTSGSGLEREVVLYTAQDTSHGLKARKPGGY